MKSKITIAELYSKKVHGITFTLFDRFIGAKVYKFANNGSACEVRLNTDTNSPPKLVYMDIEQLKEFRDNVDFLYRVAKEKIESEKV